MYSLHIATTDKVNLFCHTAAGIEVCPCGAPGYSFRKPTFIMTLLGDTMSDYYTKVTSSLGELTHSQRKVANFVLDNLDTMAFVTLDDLAARIGISSATIIRFARSLGYAGYSEMQKDIQGEIIDKVSLPERFNETKASIKVDKLLTDTMQNDMDNIVKTVTTIPKDTLHDVVNVIGNAKTLYILGLRSSFALAHYAASRFGQIRPNVHLLQSGGMLFPEELAGMGADDVCIAFLFPRYPKMTASLLASMRKVNVKVVLFTAPNLAPVKSYGDYFIPCHIKGNAFKNSFAAPLCLIYYLATALALQHSDIANQTLQKTENVLDMGYYLGL